MVVHGKRIAAYSGSEKVYFTKHDTRDRAVYGGLGNTVSRKQYPEVDATPRRGPHGQVFVHGVEDGVPMDRSSSMGWKTGSPWTGLRPWGGRSDDLARP